MPNVILNVGVGQGAQTLAVILSSFCSPVTKNFLTLINWDGYLS